MKGLIMLIAVFISLEVCGGATQNTQAETVWDSGIFSDFTINDESGDIGGMEIYVVNGSTNNFAMIHQAAGYYLDPILVRLEKTKKDHVFTYDRKSGNEIYKCTLTITHKQARNECVPPKGTPLVNNLTRKQ